MNFSFAYKCNTVSIIACYVIKQIITIHLMLPLSKSLSFVIYSSATNYRITHGILFTKRYQSIILVEIINSFLYIYISSFLHLSYISFGIIIPIQTSAYINHSETLIVIYTQCQTLNIFGRRYLSRHKSSLYIYIYIFV